MRIEEIADQTIKPTGNFEQVLHEQGSTFDIIEVILHADGLSQEFTEEFAPHLQGESRRQSAENVWRFIKENIAYRTDRPGHERVQSPGKLWSDKVGDCKSFSIFTGSILQNLAIPYRYRFSHHPTPGGLDEVNHVFVVAIGEGGEEIVIDAVADHFDWEAPYEYALDYDPSTKKIVNRISGLQPAGKEYPLFTLLLFALLSFTINRI